MILTKTPYRIALSGGGTDLGFYYKKRGGCLYTLAIDQYVYVHLSERSLDDNYLIQTSDTNFFNKLKDVKHDLIRETLKYYNIKEKVHVGTYSTIPTKTGLGSSSATVVGLINCIKKFKNLKISEKQIIKDAYKIERKICGQHGGWQDQTISQLGGLVKLNVSKKEIISYKKIKISKKMKDLIKNHLLLIYTKRKRDSAKVILSQKKNENIISIYDSIKSLNNDFIDSFKKKKIKKLANLFNVHWELKKKISNIMSNNVINSLYKKLIIKHNCEGGKLIGAGGGGFFLMVVKNKKKFLTSLRNSKITYLNFDADSRGSRIIDTTLSNFKK